MWVVDEFVDRVAERDEKRIRKENAWREAWKRKPLDIFDTRESAVGFMVERAEQRVAKAERELAAERKRLKKCEAKREG